MEYKLKEVVLEAEVPNMIRLCAWCGEFLGVKPGIPGKPTGGMCDACEIKWYAQLEERKRLLCVGHVEPDSRAIVLETK
jgi:hypothetical protein